MDDSHSMTAAGFSQAGRLLAIDSPLGPGALLMTRLDGEDAISRCFLYRVEVVATVPDASVEALLGEAVTLWFMSGEAETRRPIHGHVRSVAGKGHDAHDLRRFELEVVPRLWFLSCTCDCRVFQNLSVPDILRTVFTEQGLTDVAFRLVQDAYPQLDYCVQYEESALDFVARLMEHLGMFYWFEHAADRHVLVIGDRNDATSRCDPPSVTVSPNPQRGEVQTLDFRSVFRPGKWTLNDYDFTSPTKRLLVDTPTTLNVPRMRRHEIYRWAGEFVQHDEGRSLSRLRIEMEEAQHRIVRGTGHCTAFDPGRRVAIDQDRNQPATVYLLTEVRHHATSPGLESSADAPPPGYANEFVAIPVNTPFRPPLVTPQPFMQGPQTATVVGPPGEQIYCDEYGRVRVQFHWDRLGQRNENSSCWIRVSQTRAGSYYGSLSIPHVGHEVIVAFLEGDPDRPLIVGSVPNALTMPPVELPFDKHKTIHRDHADNRMIMQGKPGQEHLSLVSPRRVNTFAVRQGARPLSSNGTINTADIPFNFGTVTIDPTMDHTGLYEVWEGWYMLNNPTDTAIPNDPLGSLGAGGQHDILNDLTSGPESGDILKLPGTTTTKGILTSGTGTAGSNATIGSNVTITNVTTTASANVGVAITADDCDINSYTDGRNNAVIGTNKNRWVGGNQNTWVQQDNYTKILQNSTTEIDGHSSSTVGGNATAEVDQNSVSIVHDCAVSLVYMDRTSFTGVTNQSLVFGLNLAVNLMGAISINPGYYYSYTPMKTDQDAVKFHTNLATVEQKLSHIATTATKMEDTATLLHTVASMIVTAELEIHS